MLKMYRQEKGKIKIMFILPSLQIGGAEKTITNIVRKIDKQRFDTTLLILNGSNSFFVFGEQEKINVIKLNYLHIRKSIFKLIKIIYETKPAVILTTITHLNIFVAILRVFFFRSIKLIARESNVLKSIYDTKLNLNNIFIRVFHKISYKNTDLIVCQSDFMKSEIKFKFGIDENKLAVINNPVLFYKNVGGENIDFFDLIAIGNLNGIKGYERMIDVIVKLNDKSIKLGIIGEGSERSTIEKLIAKFELNDQVKLLGMQPNPFIFLENARMLLMTSYYEGFPNVILEAGICGLPVIAYNVPGGISEMIEDGFNGFLVHDGNACEMALCIEMALNYSFNTESIIQYTKQKYDINFITKKYEQIIENAIINNC